MKCLGKSEERRREMRGNIGENVALASSARCRIESENKAN